MKTKKKKTRKEQIELYLEKVNKENKKRKESYILKK